MTSDKVKRLISSRYLAMWIFSFSLSQLFLLGGIKLVNITKSPVWFSANTTLAELKCSFKGWPRPRIFWHNPHRKLIINGSESFYLTEELVGEDTITSVLRNPNIQEKHEGKYECFAVTTIDFGKTVEKSEKIQLRYNCK